MASTTRARGPPGPIRGRRPRPPLPSSSGRLPRSNRTDWSMSRLALLHPAVIGMGLRVAAVRLRRAAPGQRRYEGSAEEILSAGLEACWSGEILTASPGTYRHFWTRDLGFAAPALLTLGGPWPDRLRSSLAWALDTWRRRGSHVTTTIDPVLRWP